MRNPHGNESVKIKWQGQIKSIQPRTRVWQYVTDNRTHYHIGYNVFLEGESDEGLQSFAIAISEKQPLKGQFRIGDIISVTVCGKVNVSLATMRRWLMWKFNGILTGISKNTDLNLFATDLKHANLIRLLPITHI